MEDANHSQLSQSHSPIIEDIIINVEHNEHQKMEQIDTPLSPVIPDSLLQKRVLPTRSRRGGPGIGSTDIDLIILDAQRRAEENKPLIPATSSFLLLTDHSLVPTTAEHSDGTGAKPIATNSYESYFDRPEVARAFREQQLIEIPVFTEIPSDAVGGRLRARTADEDTSDTSDGAYIARHRKYETFEKRQRRREKEKLVNEHQKLKARIEQLRAMDAAAFGGKDSEESEKKRKAMLSTAEDLEARYRVLLPEPRHRPEKKPLNQAAESESDDGQPPPASKRLTIKISGRPALNGISGSSYTPQQPERLPRKKGRPPKPKMNQTLSQNGVPPPPPHTYTYTSRTKRQASKRAKHDASEWVPNPGKRSSASGNDLEMMDYDSTGRLSEALTGESNGDPPSYYKTDSPDFASVSYSGRGRPKRMRYSVSTAYEPPRPAAQIAADAQPSTCALLRQATRNDATTRKTKRAHEPLGVKLGNRVEEPSDYEVTMSNLLLAFWADVRPTPKMDE